MTTSDDYISWQDFQRVELRVGTVVRAEVFEEARRPAYKLWVDLGESLGVKKSSAQITARYHADELVGTQVLCVVNFAPKQIGPMMSEVLVTGFYEEEGGAVILARPDRPVPNGSRLC